MSAPVGQLADAMARRNFEFFFRRMFHILSGEDYREAWHVEAIAHHLEEIASGRSRRLIINIPPRYLKSQMASVAFPAWLLGNDPAAKILVTSYSNSLAEELHDRFQRLVQSPLYQQIFPHMRGSTRRSTSAVFKTQSGGSREAISLSGSMTGFGFNYIIIDDPMKPGDARSPVERASVIDTYQDTIYTRLEPKESARLVVVMQRLHEDDLTGFLLEKGGWTHLELPAIAQRDALIPIGAGRLHARRIGDVLCPAWENEETLARMRREMGEPVFRTQWLMDTSAPEGTGVRWSQCRFYESPPPRDACEMVVISWDTASSLSESADYTVGTVWGQYRNKWYLLDLIRGKFECDELYAKVACARRDWRPDQIIVEQAGSGIGLIQRLMRDQRQLPGWQESYGCQHLAIDPLGSKNDRMLLNVDRLYSGDFLLPREAPWLETLRREIAGFPGGRHDDQVDSISQFIIHAGSGLMARRQRWMQEERRRQARLARSRR